MNDAKGGQVMHPLRRKQIESGLTAALFARSLGINHATVSRIVAGQAPGPCALLRVMKTKRWTLDHTFEYLTGTVLASETREPKLEEIQ